MKIYNTMTQKKEEFQPIDPPNVKMYVCGPTVYDYMHIGNGKSAVVFDMVRRFLEYKGFQVNYVQNYTDVDDKIIDRANKEGVTSQEIAERYTKAAEEDLARLGVKPATKHPKATEEIDGMVAMIQQLMDKGHAYEKKGTVYFRTSSFPSYGRLSKKNMDELEAGARVAVDEDKESPLDFVLWKPKKEGEPSWPSPWSDGRPGWHIECSVMSKKYLGEQIDIHAGGEDLIFPHHENEIAQSEAANGKEFARYWMHLAFLNIDNRKMSKSLGNFFTIRDVEEQFPLPALRFFLLSAHYRSPLNFSRELMQASCNGWNRIQTALYNMNHFLSLPPAAERGDGDSVEQGVAAELEALHARFDEAMEDDFNTADAISIIFEMVRLANTSLDSHHGRPTIQALRDKILLLCGILGLAPEVERDLLDDDVERLIAERGEARKNRDFAKADEIRKTLLDQGVVLEDTREGVRWKRM